MTELDVPRTDRQPGVTVLPAQGETCAVVLVLHGGKANSYDPSDRTHLSSVRMKPFATELHREGAERGVAVWRLRYRVRGWNAPERSPALDAQWALEEIRRRHGDVPVILLGHSMGGRAAVHVLGDPSVTAMVALCPWLPDEPVAGARGKRILLAHAKVDRWTSTQETFRWAEQARPLAQSLTYVSVSGTGHFMLRRWRLWRDLATGFALGAVEHTRVDPSVGRIAANVLSEAAAGATRSPCSHGP